MVSGYLAVGFVAEKWMATAGSDDEGEWCLAVVGLVGEISVVIGSDNYGEWCLAVVGLVAEISE